MTPASSWAERTFLVLDAARRDAQWAVAHKGAIAGGRIRDRGAAEQLAPAVEAALNGLVLDAILVGNGPGSFAGLRIVLAFAKGLAKGLGIPIVAVSSLAAMLREPVEADVALLNAFSGQIYAHGDAASGALTGEQLRPLVAGKRAVIDGDVPGLDALGLGAIADLRALGHDLPLGVLALGAEAYARGERADVDSLVPDYGRASTAELRQNQLIPVT